MSINLITTLTTPSHASSLPNVPIDNLPTLTTCLSLSGTSLTCGSDNRLRRSIYQTYIDAGDFSEAAATLSTLRFDSALPNYTFTPSEILDVYVTVSECYIEDDDSVKAEVFVGKAASVVAQVDPASTEVLRFQSTRARVLDAQRKFLQASEFYYQLSTATHPSIHPPDLLLLLAKSCTTAVLGKSGPRRRKVLSLLACDARLVQLSSIPGCVAHSDIVLRMHRLELLGTTSTAAFAGTLAP
ncbi:hypothetical protein TrRE_jg9457, partial [Triparma retinervis]